MHRGNPNHRPWSPEEDEQLRQHFGRVSWHQLEEILPGRTRPALSARAGILGLRRQKESPWRPDDDATVRALFGQVPLAEIARRLARTETAVKVRAKRLGLRHRKRRALTANQVSRILWVCVKTAKWWIRRRWLRARLAPTAEKRIHLVEAEDLITFLRAHPERWDARRCPNLHVALGLTHRRGEAALSDRPLWLKEKLAADLRRHRQRQRWTLDDDRQLALLLRQGRFSYREIGQRLGRTADAVDRRIHRLGRRIWYLARQTGA